MTGLRAELLPGQSGEEVVVWLMQDQFLSPSVLQGLLAIVPPRTDCERIAVDNRLFVGAVPWTARSGAPWRDLPEKFGPWNGVYQRFARWRNCGVWQRLFCVLAGDADFEEALIDTITASGSEAVIRRANQTESRTFDRHIYQGRNLADRFPSYQALSQNSNALR